MLYFPPKASLNPMPLNRLTTHPDRYRSAGSERAHSRRHRHHPYRSVGTTRAWPHQRRRRKPFKAPHKAPQVYPTRPQIALSMLHRFGATALHVLNWALAPNPGDIQARQRLHEQTHYHPVSFE